MSRADALAAIAAAASSQDILGQLVNINGANVTAVKVVLPREDAEQWGAGGLHQEVITIAGSLAEIGFVPIERSRVDIDGHSYEILNALARGDFLKFVGMRYVG